jgi:hypothetical protein
VFSYNERLHDQPGIAISTPFFLSHIFCSQICARLITCGLIKGDSPREDLHQRIQLAPEVTPDHVQFALSEDLVGKKFYHSSTPE